MNMKNNSRLGFTSYLLPPEAEALKELPPGTCSAQTVNLSSSRHYSAPEGRVFFEDRSLTKEISITRYASPNSPTSSMP